jgi:hypothetical protein
MLSITSLIGAEASPPSGWSGSAQKGDCMKQKIWRIGMVFSFALVVFLVTVGATFVGSTTTLPRSASVKAAGVDFSNCRLGVGLTRNSIGVYNYTPTHVGWYHNWSAPLIPVRPGNMEFYNTVEIRQDKSGGVFLDTVSINPPLTMDANGLGPIIHANPGSVWILGNEIDRRGQSETMPDKYAEAYHDTYQFVKSIDPTARIAIGSVVEPTPLRLEYLDKILYAYRVKYRTPMPIDVWNIHMYILPELVGSWGAEVPPGSTVNQGRLYTAADNVNLNVFKSLIREMRVWMKSRGYQDRPLIFTEFGALLPLWWMSQNGVTQQQMNQFNRDAVYFMNTATDADLGYVADGYHLVQRSALYSMDDDSPAPGGEDGEFAWGTFLFRSTSPFTLTSIGQYYIEQIAAPLTPTVDLLPYRYQLDPASIVVLMSETVTTTLRVSIANAGNAITMNSLPQSTTVRVTDVTGGGSTLLGEHPIYPAGGCGNSVEISAVWPNLAVGLHVARIEVNPDHQVMETITSNNIMTVTVLVGSHGVYLPLIGR